MNTNSSTYAEQLNMFIRYCQKHPIDMKIINKLDRLVIHSLRDSVYIRHDCNTNNVYMLLKLYSHIYMFRFKNNESLHKFAFSAEHYSFDYNETSITLNEHDLKYVIFKDVVFEGDFFISTKYIYTFDEITKYVIIKNRLNGQIYLHNDIRNFIDISYNNKLANNGWKHISSEKLPDQIKQLATAQQVFLALSPKL